MSVLVTLRRKSGHAGVMSVERRLTMVFPLRAFHALVAGCLASCGGGSDKTCHQEIITYKGSQSGPAYLRIRSDDRSSYFGINDNVSMESLSTSMAHSDVCWSGGPHIDIPCTATAWIDVSGT